MAACTGYRDNMTNSVMALLLVVSINGIDYWLFSVIGYCIFAVCAAAVLGSSVNLA